MPILAHHTDKSPTSDSHDVVIVGGGPAASFTALFLQRHGIRSCIVEREVFPRYHIGESLTGEVGGILRELGLEQHLQGSNYPVKHGVHVYGRDGTNRFWVPVMKRSFSGELTPTTTWQVRRDEFDDYLLQAAINRGATHIRANAEAVIQENGAVTGVKISSKDGKRTVLRSRVLVDASGQGTFLANHGVTGSKQRGNYEKQTAIYTRVHHAVRDPGDDDGNTLIFYHSKHRWAWFIPLDEKTTSIGIVVPAEELSQSNMNPADFLRARLADLNPALATRMQCAEFSAHTRTASNYSYHVQNFTGKGFLCVGDSHRFIDPIFSFGVFFAANEAKMAAKAISEYLTGLANTSPNPFADYEELCESGQQVIQDLIDFFWEFPLAFQVMAHKTHKEQITDCFAGRVYQADNPSDAVASMRRMLAKVRISQSQINAVNP